MPGPLLEEERVRRAVVCWALALVTSLGACASPFAETEVQTEDGSPPRDLARTASSAPNGSVTKDTSGDGGTRQGRDDPADLSEGPGGNDEQTGNAEGRVPPEIEDFTVIGSISDAEADASESSPEYADVVGVTIGENGTRARVVVEVAGALPANTGRAEVESLGVDLYRRSGDYQLFASGEPGGWFGYLYTPEGFVAYRGDLHLGRRTLTFTVPWDAIGGRGSGEFGMFLDWSGSGDRFAQDLAPESGTVPFGGTP